MPLTLTASSSSQHSSARKASSENVTTVDSSNSGDFPQQLLYVDLEKAQPKNYFRRACNSFKHSEEKQPSLKHELNNFQMQMIAIGGSIGTGLFLGTGEALRVGGPAALIIGWTLIGTMIYCTVHSLCELAVTFPVPGGFSYYSSVFIDGSWGFAMALNYAMQWLILLPLELSAATMTFKYWNDFPIPDWALITGFFLTIIAINLMSVKIFGYAEVIFSLTKIVAVIAFIILGLVLVFGGLPAREAILDKNWKDPGPFANGFKGVISVFVTAAFSFAGTEMCGLAAAESKDPRKHVPKATKQVFWRICGFYFISLALIGLLVPSNYSNHTKRSETDTRMSPFTVALEATGVKGIASVMNVVILISILSVGNSAIYASSRTLLALHNLGHIKTFSFFNMGYIDRKGRPLVAIAFTLVFGMMAYGTLISETGALTLFTWLMALSGLSSLFTWGSICLAHIRFRAGLVAQGRSPSELGYISPVGVVGSYYGLAMNAMVLIAQVWIAASPVGHNASIELSLKAILGLPIVLLSYLIHKIYKAFVTKTDKSFYISSKDMDLDRGRQETDIAAAGICYEEERREMRQRPPLTRLYNFWC
ncbi:unnamed protein product [Kuraishia capsulata CBS 1993]|uniref:Amino acid permease/ SLC12A domain-containing protein n=1 Tax=Kuraishia capsulata CBS 1993 TaxID=1382522 RepID=W6MUA8_9ASCO|nr:uncharacterized protein KUCA_T00001485001 [Kuraishia capsulata CBS 1993]CDK25515.1 unnamed protein product [Kuraishia capsulata CBS 1993]